MEEIQRFGMEQHFSKDNITIFFRIIPHFTMSSSCVLRKDLFRELEITT